MTLIWKVAYRHKGRKNTVKFQDIIDANELSNRVQESTEHIFLSQTWELV